MGHCLASRFLGCETALVRRLRRGGSLVDSVSEVGAKGWRVVTGARAELCDRFGMSVVGYARVSTGRQSLDHQQDAFTAAGCERIFADKLSGVREDRPGLAALVDYVRAGDTVVVVALDRLGRSLSGVIRTVETLTPLGCCCGRCVRASTTGLRWGGCWPGSSRRWPGTSGS